MAFVVDVIITLDCILKTTKKRKQCMIVRLNKRQVNWAFRTVSFRGFLLVSFQPTRSSSGWVTCSSSSVDVEREGSPFCWAREVPSDDEQMNALESVAFQSCSELAEYFTFQGIHLFNSHCAPGACPFTTCAFGLALYWFCSLFHSSLYIDS